MFIAKSIEKIIEVFTPDVVQLPINVFDRRFLKKEILQKINNNKIEIHIRSIFLQGILLKKFLNSLNIFISGKNIFRIGMIG